MDLAGLSEEDVAALVASVAGHAIEDDASARMIRSLARDSGGNPLFVWEMLRHVVDSGGVVQDASGRWSVTDQLMRNGLPQSLHEVVEQRLVRLGPEGLRVLSLAAVMGADIEPELLSAVAETGEDEVLDLLEEAQKAAIVTEVADLDPEEQHGGICYQAPVTAPPKCLGAHDGDDLVRGVV